MIARLALAVLLAPLVVLSGGLLGSVLRGRVGRLRAR